MNTIGCKIKHDQIFNIKCTILDLVQHLRPKDQWCQMQQLFALFDRLPSMADEGNKLSPLCSRCTFPQCKDCESIVAMEEWLRSGKYMTCQKTPQEWKV